MKSGLLMGILPAAVVAAFVTYEGTYQPLVYSLNIVSYVNVTPSPPTPPTVTDHFWLTWTRLGAWGFEQYHSWEGREEMWGVPVNTGRLRTSTVVFLGRLIFEVPMPAWILGVGTFLLLGIAATPGTYYGAGRRRRVQSQAPILD